PLHEADERRRRRERPPRQQDPQQKEEPLRRRARGLDDDERRERVPEPHTVPHHPCHGRVPADRARRRRRGDGLPGESAREERHEWHRRSEEHTSELQSLTNLVCRLLLEKKKKNKYRT